MDVVYIALVALLWVAAWGLAVGCNRLAPKEDRK